MPFGTRAAAVFGVAALVAVVFAFAVAGCGGDDQTTSTVPTARGDQLEVTVWPEGRDGEATRAAYSCPADGGKACAIIAAWEPETLAPTLDGDHVDAAFSRANGCEIERFDVVSELLELVVPGITTAPIDAAQAPPESQGRGPSDRVEAAVSDYVEALDDRDGARVCSLFVPGALDDLKLPEERSTCGASMTASIGYRDPRGLPVWESSRILYFRAVHVNGDHAQTTVTVRTLYADRNEPSLEDDVVYLQGGNGGGWLLVKPSVTLYRAIGVADVPPQVLAPP